MSGAYMLTNSIGEAPPEEREEHDTRPLFEVRCLANQRLEEQRQLKQERIDDLFARANKYRGLDEHEATFLAEVELERRLKEVNEHRDDQKRLEEFRLAAEERMMQPPPAPRVVPPMRKGGAAKRKREAAAALGVVRKDEKRSKDQESDSKGAESPKKTISDSTKDAKASETIDKDNEEQNSKRA